MTPFYEEPGIRIFHGDCLELLPQLTDVGVVVTDPPYNAGKSYGEATDDRRPWPEWVEWMDNLLDEGLAAAPDGVLAFLSQTAYRQHVRLSRHEMAWSAVWVKPLSMAICAAPFMPHWEPIAYWGNKRRRRGDGTGWGSDVITANVERGRSRWDHPTPKPLAAMLQLLSKMDGLICDPCMGSGTTLVAAKQLGLPAVGIDINEAYCVTAVERLRQGSLFTEPAAPAEERALPL